MNFGEKSANSSKRKFNVFVCYCKKKIDLLLGVIDKKLFGRTEPGHLHSLGVRPITLPAV